MREMSDLLIDSPPELNPRTMDSCARFDHLTTGSPDRDAISRAAQMRNPTAVSVPGRKPMISRNNQFDAWDAGHPVRQEFRRLLDGILRNNYKKDAAKALRVRDLRPNQSTLDLEANIWATGFERDN